MTNTANERWLTTIQESLSEQDAKRLQAIYAPKAVAVPLENARANLCVMPDGEIRA